MEVQESAQNTQAIVHLAAIPMYVGEDQKIMEIKLNQ